MRSQIPWRTPAAAGALSVATPSELSALSHAAVLESEQRLRAIVDTAIDAIITIFDDGSIESANAATQRLFGYQSGELIGRNVSMLMPQPYRGQHDRFLQRHLKTHRRVIIGTGREVVGRRKDGSLIPIHLSISEFVLNGRRMFTAIIHDLTERRRLERQVIDVGSAEQRRIGQELHDGICQNLVGTALRISVLGKRLSAIAPASAAEAEDLARFIRQIADEARQLSHGLAPLEISRGGLRQALEELAKQTTALFNVICTLECPSELPSYPGDTATHVYRITQEAITNAIRHGNATRIVIRIIADAMETVLTVSDDGRGFAGTSQAGLGIQTMHFRARVIGGWLKIAPAPHHGVIITCTFASRLPKRALARRASSASSKVKRPAKAPEFSYS